LLRLGKTEKFSAIWDVAFFKHKVLNSINFLEGVSL